jgi:hypothetical protein
LTQNPDNFALAVAICEVCPPGEVDEISTMARANNQGFNVLVKAISLSTRVFINAKQRPLASKTRNSIVLILQQGARFGGLTSKRQSTSPTQYLDVLTQNPDNTKGRILVVAHAETKLQADIKIRREEIG